MRIQNSLLPAVICWFAVSIAYSQEYQTTTPPALTAEELAQLSFTPEARIARANAAFREQVESFPDQETNVTASFTQPRSIHDAVAEAQAHGLTIQGFRHGDASSSGGYTMTAGEDIEKALRQYEYDLKFFPEQDLKLTEQMLASEKDPTLIEALQTRKRDIIARQQKQEKEGFVIVGIDLRGRGKALKQFSDERPYVLGMELRDGARRSSAIFPNR